MLAATILAGGDPLSSSAGSALLAMTLFYVGGMYLNDAFDREIDRRERPGRPIPAGLVSAGTGLASGLAMLAAGIVVMALRGAAPALMGLVLAAAIVAYDLRHKGNPVSPVLMGVCRMLVYTGTATMVAGRVSGPVFAAGVAVLAHTAGLTYAAKQESLDRIGRLWPLAVLAAPLVLAAADLAAGPVPAVSWAALLAADALAIELLRRRTLPGAVPRAVGALIAALSLVDAVLVAPLAPVAAAFCWAGYGLTRVFQRFIPGT